MIILENVSKTFGTGLAALDDISLGIGKGEFVFLTGQSGSGKTTLLRLLIRDMLPSTGSIFVNEVDVVKLPNNKVPHLRRRIGVVFQDLKMLTDRTIFENIILPLEMINMDKKAAQKQVDEILEQVGIIDHKHKFPVQLSGGELQRAAIARALIFSPDILLADEPTGNLDSVTAWEIIKLLQDINKKGTTVVMATHNADIINSLMKRIVILEKGKLIKDKHPKKEGDDSKENNGTHKTQETASTASDTKGATEEKEEKKDTAVRTTEEKEKISEKKE